MRLLAIDTAANLCAACIYDAPSGDVLAVRSLDVGKGHVEYLMPMVQQAMDEAQIGYPDLNRVVVNVGPGTFTGVRVGVAAARGFSLALDIPAVGVSVLDAIAAEARSVHPGRAVLVVTDARRNEVYSAGFDAKGKTTMQPRISAVSALGESLHPPYPLLAGSAAVAVVDAVGSDVGIEFGPVSATASIETLAMLGADAVIPAHPPKPMYLRAPDAKRQSGFAVARVDR